MDGTLFYYVGGALVLAALVLSFIGIRGKESFPPSGRALAGISALFGVLVIATAAYGVANAREEVDHREKELAEEEAHAAAEEPAKGGEPGAPPAKAPPAAAETLDVTSPDDGSLSFEPDSFSTKAGTITLAYDNPSPVAHNISIKDNSGQTLAESETVTGDATEASAELVPGEYVFFCSIPGHETGGMEGTLTVE